MIDKKEEEPVGIWFIDLGEKAICLKCHKRYCTCIERQNGTWECYLSKTFRVVNPDCQK